MADSNMYIGWLNSTGDFSINRYLGANHTTPKLQAFQDQYSVDLMCSTPNWVEQSFSFCTQSDVLPNSPFIYAASNTPPSGNIDDPKSAILPVHDASGSFKFDVGSDNPIIKTTPTAYQKIVGAHGVLMFIAWIISPFVGIFITKKVRSILGHTWYIIHLFCMAILTGVGTIAAFVLMILYSQDWNQDSIGSTHGKLGLVVVFGMIVEIVLGNVVHTNLNHYRFQTSIWEIAHKWIGNCLGPLGFISVYLGLHTYSDIFPLPNWILPAFWFLVALMLSLVVFDFVFQFMRKSFFGALGRNYKLLIGTGITGVGLSLYALNKPAALVPTRILPEVKEMLADTELDKILHQNEKSIFVNKHVYRIDFNTIASNNPSEDQSSQHQLGDSYLVGVYDGHGGRECGELVMKHLASYIAHHLSKPRTLPEKEHTIKALEDAFVAIDSDIINGSLPYLTSNDHKSIIKNLQAVRSGCCAVVALINKSDVYVANSGDCRAVLGRKRAYQRNGEPAGYQTIELSEDHTFSNTREYARMLKEHPGEDDTVVVRGRVLGGLMPTRAIGDARYKWPIDIMRVVSPFISRKGRTIIPPNYHSPPYVTAKPDVNHYIFDGNDHFMIIACDGLWDDISSSDAVNHIGELIQKDYKGNFATDLMIKALGQERESVRHILSIPAPQSRRYRDDLTVNVVLLKPSGSDKGAPIEPVPKMPYLYKKQLDYWVQKLETFTKSKL